MKNSFKIVTILGIPIEINISWFIILGLVIFTLAKGYFPFQIPNLPLIAYWVMGLVTAVLLFVCLILHELSHSVVARLNKLPISGITLFVFGGVAHMEKEPQSPMVELKMAIAGPAMSLLLALFFWILSITAMRFALPHAAWLITDYLSFFNTAIAIFNLIPGFPLDGGRVLRAILWLLSKNLKKATRIASTLGEFFAALLIAAGFLALITANFVSGVWFIFIGFFLLEAAQMSYHQLLMRRTLSGVKIKDIMSKNVISIRDNPAVSNLIEDYLFRYRHNCFPVIEDDSLIGIITFHDAKETPKNEWSTTHAKDIMIPINSSLLISGDHYVEEALPQLAHNGLQRLLVIEDGKLVGIVTQKDIMKLFQFRSETEH